MCAPRNIEGKHDRHFKIPIRKACVDAVRQGQIQMTIGINVVYSLYCYPMLYPISFII